MDRAKIVKVTVIVLGFAVAAAFSANFFLSDGPEPVAPADANLVDLVCVESGDHVQVTFEFIQSHGGLANEGKGKRPSANPEPEKVVIYPVSECGEKGAVLAHYCIACEVFYPETLPDGTKSKCPRCGQ